MPLIRVQTSTPIDQAARAATMKSLSGAVAEILGKPESYVMVVLEPETPMLFAAGAEPAAFAEVRSVGQVSADQSRSLSARICEIMGAEAGIDSGRVFVNCAGVDGAMWGFDGRTFG